MPAVGGLRQLRGVRRQKSILIVPMDPQGPDDRFALDLSESQDLDLPGSVTRHPVADTTLSDNVYLEPAELTVQGEITDTPVVYGSGFRSLANAQADRALRLWDKLVELRDRKARNYVIRSVGTSINMVIESLSQHRDPDTGAAIGVRIHFVHVRTVRKATIAAEFDSDAKALGAGGTQNLGDQPASTSPPQNLNAASFEGLAKIRI